MAAPVITLGSIVPSSNGTTAAETLNIPISAAGNNRIVVIACLRKDSNGAGGVVSSITFDSAGVNRTIGAGVTRQGLEQLAIEGSYSSLCDVYFILEADLPAAAGTYAIDTVLAAGVAANAWGAFEVTDVTAQAYADISQIADINDVGANTQMSQSLAVTNADSLVVSLVSISISGTYPATSTDSILLDESFSNGNALITYATPVAVSTKTFGHTIAQVSQRRAWTVLSFANTTSDTTPDPFDFTDNLAVNTSTLTLSNIITVTGIDAASPIAITTTDGAEFSINGGAFTAVSTTVVVNDTVQLRVTSSASNSTSVSATLDIGGVTDLWTVTTAAAASPSVDDVNAGSIADAEIGATFTTSNFAGEITTVQIISGSATTSGANIASSSGNGTFDLPNIIGYAVDTLGAPLTSTNNSTTVRLSDGANTADNLVTSYVPAVGYAVIEIQGAVTTQGSVFENFVGTPPNNSQVLYPTAFSTSVAADGIYTSSATSNVEMVYWDSVLLNWQPFTGVSFGTITDTLESSSGVPVASETLDFFVTQTFSGAVTDSGTTTTDASGVFILSNITANNGAAWVHIKNQGSDDIAAVFPVTVT